MRRQVGLPSASQKCKCLENQGKHLNESRRLVIVLHTPADFQGCLALCLIKMHVVIIKMRGEESKLPKDLFQLKQNCLTVVLNMALEVMFSQKLVSEAKTCTVSCRGISETSAGLVDTRAILFKADMLKRCPHVRHREDQNFACRLDRFYYAVVRLLSAKAHCYLLLHE